MIRQDKKSKTRFIIFLALYAVLVPFSLAWYNTLINIDCNHAQGVESNPVKIDSSENGQQNCMQQTNFHWVKFYGINGVMYGAPLAALIMTIKRKGTN
jgi:hypothetical protein